MQCFEYFRYNRSQSPYEPPKNVSQTVNKLKADAKLTSGFSGQKFRLEDKFSFLLLCSQEFNHTVPNSSLHEIETIGICLLQQWMYLMTYWFDSICSVLDDVIEFYKTPINTFLPLDELLTRELPPNLHIEKKYHRFHPDTDTMFNGKTAFPGSSTIVTGITTRKRYTGHKSVTKLGIDEDPL